MRLRAAGLVLALAAITFKAFLPPGFMLAEQGGRVGITLCSSDGAEVAYDVISGEFTDKDDGKRSNAAGQICPFALASAPACAPSLIAVAAPCEAPSIHVARTPLSERPHAAPIGPPLPARGPPLQA